VPELVLIYTCGCRESFPASRLQPDWEPEQHSEHICPVDGCQSCLEHGRRCPEQEKLGGAAAYTPITYSDIAPKRRYTRSKR
jgi:hypothetical protein